MATFSTAMRRGAQRRASAAGIYISNCYLDYSAADVLPYFHGHSLQVVGSCAPEVAGGGFERRREYVERAGEVEQRQQEGEHELPATEVADRPRDRVRNRFLRRSAHFFRIDESCKQLHTR